MKEMVTMSLMKKILLFVLIIASCLMSFFVLRKKERFTQKTPDGLVHSVDFSALAELGDIIPIAVLGSGPAGLSSALYGSRAGMHTVVFSGPTLMGQLTGTSDIENWPGVPKSKGTDVMTILKDQATTFGAKIVLDTVKSIDLSRWPFKLKTTEGKQAHALSVILAMGANPRLLGIEGEHQYWGKGVTTCAVCDAPYYKGGKVIVVGGGDSAAEEAMQLAPYAASITIMVRGDKMRASAIMQERLKEYPTISVQYNREVTKIIGDENHVTAVDILNNQTQETINMPIDGVFLAIGHIPNTQIVESQLELDNAKLVKVNCPTQQTSVKGVFAAGEVSDGLYRQAGVASGDGIKAALDALSFLREIGFAETDAEVLSPQYFTPETRVKVPPLEKITSLDEFEKKVAGVKGVEVLDFYADYCPSCLQMMPLMEQVAHEFSDLADVYKVDASASPEIGKHLDVTSLPTILVFKDGKKAYMYTKAMNSEELRSMMKQATS